jgi:hypothetical protein
VFFTVCVLRCPDIWPKIGMVVGCSRSPLGSGWSRIFLLPSSGFLSASTNAQAYCEPYLKVHHFSDMTIGSLSAGLAVEMNTSSSLFYFLFMKPCLS